MGEVVLILVSAKIEAGNYGWEEYSGRFLQASQSPLQTILVQIHASVWNMRHNFACHVLEILAYICQCILHFHLTCSMVTRVT